jgi:4-hydroxybenzoate polyprenyltransferase
MPRLRAHHWLATIPAAAILVGVPFANRARGYVLGLPFLLFWIVACVLATSAIMAVIGALDRRDAASPPGPDPAGPKDERS